MPPLIEYRNVTVMRGERVVLDGITMAIGLGEHIAIVGPNGSGKSSLIKTMTRECYPLLAPGSFLRIMGKQTWNIFELRPLLGIVSADLTEACVGNYKGREIILSGYFSSVGIWPHHEVTPQMERETDEVLELLEIPHLADRNMWELSTGEARRIVIARALVHHPKALVLDEPTASLDLHVTYGLREILRKVAAQGTSIIMVTHHLHDIIPEIQRVVLLKDGRLFEDGPKREVLTQPTLGRLFGTTFELIERDGYYTMW